MSPILAGPRYSLRLRRDGRCLAAIVALGSVLMVILYGSGT